MTRASEMPMATPTRRRPSRIGRIAGVPIEANWTLLIAYVLITLTLADKVFPVTDPGVSRSASLVMATVSTLLFYVGIVLHELGHAIAARRQGVETERVTLWLFGGIAHLRGRIPSAAAERRIAVAGPLVTVGLIGGLLALANVLALPASVESILSWLIYINVILLVFNLLPALPLDGGRVLRSVLWSHRGDYQSATVIASDISRVLAIGMIVLGLAGSFSTGIGGLWLALLGWFLLMAGAAERRAASAPVTRPSGRT